MVNGAGFCLYSHGINAINFLERAYFAYKRSMFCIHDTGHCAAPVGYGAICIYTHRNKFLNIVISEETSTLSKE